MSWMSKLYETYDRALELNLTDENQLVPISHTIQNAHINIVIDDKGNFKSAEVLKKTQIILPATESSAGRSSGEAPHPLADKLQYVAKDYAAYGGVKKAYFDGYNALLKEWCSSSFSHPKARAVLHYIEKGEVIKDLISHGVVHVDSKNNLLTNWVNESGLPELFKVLPKKTGETEQGDALVCWTVWSENDPNSETWTDKSLQQSWIDFDASRGNVKGFCFISNKIIPLAVSHPSRLRHTGDKAKLISSNDTDGFTYLGRFVNDTQACGIGFETTQKAHNALRWLISRQGYRNSDQAVVAWAVSAKAIPSPMKSAYDIPDEEVAAVVDAAEIDKNPHVDHGRNLGQVFAKMFNQKLAGYGNKLDDHEAIILMVIDSATPGRMAISYYRETNKSDFFEKLDSWYQDTQWPQRTTIELKNKKKKSMVIWIESSPPPWLIIKTAYGDNADDKLKKNTIARIIPCIVEKKQFPFDLVELCVRRVSNPQAYKSDEKWRWVRDTSVACALYKGYRARHQDINQRRNYKMSLERECKNRDYLYGRLLALAEKIERKALDNAGETRATNAERLMQRFSNHPFKTWADLAKSLMPYKIRLRNSKDSGLLDYWESEIGKVNNLFEFNQFNDPSPLSGEYLLGYYCQKNDYEKAENKSLADSLVSEHQINEEEI